MAVKTKKVIKTPQSKDNTNLLHTLVKENKNLKLHLMIAVVLVVLAVLLFAKGFIIAAFVNGEPITRYSVINSLEKQSGGQALDELVTEKLIVQEAKKMNLGVSKEEIDGEAKKIEEGLKQQNTTLEAALSQRNMTREQLNEQLKIQLLIQKMLADKITVTDKEINDYIQKNKDQLPAGETEVQIKSEISDQLKQQKQQGETQKLVDNLRKNANIIRFVSY